VLSIVIRLIIITVLVYAGVHLWYGVVEKRLQERPPAKVARQSQQVATNREQPAPVKSPVNDVQAIVERNIFQANRDGGETAATETADSELENLAQTQLSLVLLGTVTGGQNDARAIIRDEKTKLEDLYQVGSEVQGALISRIARGKVVLQVNGREEILVIKDREEEGGASSKRMATPIMPAESVDDVEEDAQNVPTAVPRRRISFRSPAPPAAAPQESDASLEQENFQSDAMTDMPPPPEEELTLPEPEQMPDVPEQEPEQAAEAHEDEKNSGQPE
jgi:type II secretory pathway component PulC